MLRRRVLWSVMTVLSLLVALAATAYLRFDPDLYFPVQRAVYLTRQLPLHLHIGGALVALAAGPWQFATRLRARRPRIHRAVGTLYLTGCLIGGIGGIALSTTAHGGAVATAGFATLGVLWLATGAAGLAAILRGDVHAHRRWMVRSFALTFAAVTLRVYVGIATVLAQTDAWSVPFSTSYAAIAWIAWVPNLAVAWWLTRLRAEDVAPPRALPALAPSGSVAP